MTHTVIPRTPFYGIEPSALPPLPRSSWKSRISSENAFVKKERFVSNAKTAAVPMWHQIILRSWILYCSRGLNASLGPYFWLLFWSWLQAAQVKLHLWVSQLHSVYFCIWRKGDGLEGGRFGAKQTARVSTLKVNITLCLNYTPWAQQFSHTLALSPLSLIPANTPSDRPS